MKQSGLRPLECIEKGGEKWYAEERQLYSELVTHKLGRLIELSRTNVRYTESSANTYEGLCELGCNVNKVG